MKATAHNYQLKRANGSHIRIATMVRFEDGQVVKFMDKMPKFQAIQQAQRIIEKDKSL